MPNPRRRQQMLSMNTRTEAEYIAGPHATKGLVWLRCLFGEVGLPNDDPTVLPMDNQSAIAIAKNLQFHDRTKHIEVRHHFKGDKIEQGELELQYIPLGGTGRARPHAHRDGLRDTFGSLPYFYGQFLYAASYLLFGSEMTTCWYS